MDEAADPLEMNDFEALCWDWGEAYEIQSTDDGWRARRSDGIGQWITASSPNDLRSRLSRDYAANPVPRPAAEH